MLIVWPTRTQSNIICRNRSGLHLIRSSSKTVSWLKRLQRLLWLRFHHVLIRAIMRWRLRSIAIKNISKVLHLLSLVRRRLWLELRPFKVARGRSLCKKFQNVIFLWISDVLIGVEVFDQIVTNKHELVIFIDIFDVLNPRICQFFYQKPRRVPVVMWV